jgi:Protein of unknown function (DUF3024)
MALTPLELTHCQEQLAIFMQRRRPPVELRDKVDLIYQIVGHSIEIWELRVHWLDKTITTKSAIAKATFVRTKNHWQVYWMRGDGKWHSYEPQAKVKNLEEFLDTVDRDEHFCFW